MNVLIITPSSGLTSSRVTCAEMSCRLWRTSLSGEISVFGAGDPRSCAPGIRVHRTSGRHAGGICARAPSDPIRARCLRDAETARGVETASVATAGAMHSYFQARSFGVTSTNKFYADLSEVSLKEVRQSLHDISQQVTRLEVKPLDHGVMIKTFIERFAPYQIGCAYYQLSKTEKVQQAKQICICDRSTGAIYTGTSARDLLGLPHAGAITLAPHNLGNYDVFIQSTSVNRKLVGGTTVLYFPSHR